MPGFGIVTGLASGSSPRRHQQHSVFELAFMRIGMADGAGAILKAKHRSLLEVLVMRRRGRITLEGRPWLVTIAAWRRYMPAG